jgi:hypothetical protein
MKYIRALLAVFLASLINLSAAHLMVDQEGSLIVQNRQGQMVTRLPINTIAPSVTVDGITFKISYGFDTKGVLQAILEPLGGGAPNGLVTTDGYVLRAIRPAGGPVLVGNTQVLPGQRWIPDLGVAGEVKFAADGSVSVTIFFQPPRRMNPTEVARLQQAARENGELQSLLSSQRQASGESADVGADGVAQGGGNAAGGNADGQNADGQNADGQNADGQNADGQNADGQSAAGQGGQGQGGQGQGGQGQGGQTPFGGGAFGGGPIGPSGGPAAPAPNVVNKGNNNTSNTTPF